MEDSPSEGEEGRYDKVVLGPQLRPKYIGKKRFRWIRELFDSIRKGGYYQSYWVNEMTREYVKIILK